MLHVVPVPVVRGFLRFDMEILPSPICALLPLSRDSCCQTRGGRTYNCHAHLIEVVMTTLTSTTANIELKIPLNISQNGNNKLS